MTNSRGSSTPNRLKWKQSWFSLPHDDSRQQFVKEEWKLTEFSKILSNVVDFPDFVVTSNLSVTNLRGTNVADTPQWCKSWFRLLSLVTSNARCMMMRGGEVWSLTTTGEEGSVIEFTLCSSDLLPCTASSTTENSTMYVHYNYIRHSSTESIKMGKANYARMMAISQFRTYYEVARDGVS